jgi:hypothetical protein
MPCLLLSGRIEILTNCILHRLVIVLLNPRAVFDVVTNVLLVHTNGRHSRSHHSQSHSQLLRLLPRRTKAAQSQSLHVILPHTLLFASHFPTPLSKSSVVRSPLWPAIPVSHSPPPPRSRSYTYLQIAFSPGATTTTHALSLRAGSSPSLSPGLAWLLVMCSICHPHTARLRWRARRYEDVDDPDCRSIVSERMRRGEMRAGGDRRVG